MEKIYEVDFSSLNDKEKMEFMYHFDDWTEETFSEYSFDVSINAQLLIFTRWWNSYRLMAAETSTPEILEIAMQQLWDFQEGKLSMEVFAQFSRCLWASSVKIATGDSSELEEDEDCKDFYAKYFWNWELFYNSFLDDIAIIFQEIVEQEITWQGIMDMLDGDIVDLKIGFFEDIDKPISGRASEIQKREMDIYKTKTCCQVVALLQKDMCIAIEQKPMAELRTLYQSEYLFPPEECVKITSDWG